MAFGNLTLTLKGRNVLSKAQLNNLLEFAYVSIGDGYYNGSFNDIQALSHELYQLPILSAKIADNTCVLECDLNNKHITKGFYLRELGIYATSESDGNILYAYDNAGEDAEYINSGEYGVTKEKRLRFILIIDTVKNITVDGESVLYVTQQSFEQQMKLKLTITDVFEITDQEIDAIDRIPGEPIDPGEPGGPANETITTEEIDSILKIKQ